MGIIKISSKTNTVIKTVKALQQKKNRADEKKFVLEGIHLIEEAVKAGIFLETVIIAESFLPEEVSFWEKLPDMIYEVPDSLFRSISQTVTPQGILAVAPFVDGDLKEAEEDRLILIADGIQDPGNLGTILRSAAAFGVDTVCLLKGTVDLYNEKTVRSTMGALFQVKLVMVEEEEYLFSSLKALGFTVLAADVHGKIDIKDVFVKDQKTAVIMGNEGNGIRQEILARCDQTFYIPIEKKTESLNVSVAAAVVMYEYQRQNSCRD